MSDHLVIAVIPKNAREEIRVTLTEFKGCNQIGLRLWGRTGTCAFPKWKEIAVTIEQCPALISSLGEALRVANAA